MPRSVINLFLTNSFILIVFMAGSAASEESAYRWPLDRETRYLTSNFMEYRGGRFHAGIDLKTNSSSGYAVRAVEDGYVTRIRATPFAYGRVVYLRGESGRTFVFAHLMRFNDELRQKLRTAQTASGGYRASVSFGPGELPVTRGQVLGLSGESGTGGPHLHFEVRDEKGWPINPLNNGFAVPDSFPPVIHTLTAWPASPEARVCGVDRHQVLVSDDSSGLQGDLPELVISGPVAFSAKIIDATDIRGHKLEPWLIEVTLDGEVVYSCRNETFTFEQNSLQRLEWADQADWQHQDFREHWLHRRTANTLVGRAGGLWYLGEKEKGLTPGVHRLEISATDLGGNLTRAALNLRVGGKATEQPGSWGDGGPALDQSAEFRMTPFFFAGSPDDPYELQVRTPEAGDPVLESLTLLVGSWPQDQPLPMGEQGLQPAGPAAFFLAADWPIDSDLTVEFPGTEDLAVAGGDDSRIGVYRLSSKKGWELVAPVRDGTLAFSMADPGLHAVLRDDVPPVIGGEGPVVVVPWQGQPVKGVTMPRWEVFAVPLVDTGSGVAPESIVVQLDGRPMLVEPDLPRDRILVELPDELGTGPHRLQVSAADEAGNSAVLNLSFECRE